MSLRNTYSPLGWMALALLALTPLRSRGQDVQEIDRKHPVKLSGSIGLQVESYTAVGIDNRRKPFSYILSGNPTLTVYGIQLPFSFLLSNFGNEYYQPFNQFGVSPSYKWVTLHLGYRNVSFNQFSLGGARMLGAGVELHPGILRVGAIYGRLNRSTPLDSIQRLNPLSYRSQLSYDRRAYAFKLGLGRDKSYFDVSYLKGWDQESSLSSDYRDSFPPQVNHVVGLSWQATIRKKLVWRTEVGASVYTQSIYGRSIIDTAKPPGALEDAARYFSVNSTTQYLLAGESRLGWRDTRFGVDLVYRRVDPDYKSMGAYFFQTDIEQYSLAPSVRLNGGRLFVSGSAGIQHDNLYGQKLATARKFIGNLNVNYNPSSKFGISANYSNYGITQNPTYISPQLEVFKQVSQNITVIPYTNITSAKHLENIQLVTSYQSLQSPGSGINNAPNQNTALGILTYSHTVLRNGLTGTATLNYNNTTIAGQGRIGSYGAGAGGSVSALKQKLQMNLLASYNSNFYNSADNGHTVRTDLTGSFAVTRRQSMSLTGSYLHNESKETSFIQTFSEYIFRVGYRFSL